VDYASRGWSGLALAIDGVPRSTSAFKSKLHKNESDARLLQEYERWLVFKIRLWKPDIVAVEQLAVFQNKKTIRALSHREGVALLVAKRTTRIVVHYTTSQARSVVFRDGSISKDDAWDAREKYIDFNFGHKTSKGGLDRLDAMTQALAAPVLLERG
jgi:Holliday junction resolvasome RuvABC endonuclease subunit